jgi:hypothetical protein|tara:strand:+ start:448 stop:1554 length:1107 start_codon:yes stop_codon:yes gene_type:complete
MQSGLTNTSNPASNLGTAVHEGGEFALHMGVSCHDLIGMQFNKIEFNEDMATAAQMHVDLVRLIMSECPNAKLIIEGKVCLSSIDPELLWGTADIIIIDGDTLYVIDYKNGYGLVEVDSDQYAHATDSSISGNAQCAGYALAAMDTHKLWGTVTKVVTGIVQPNKEHVDGLIRFKNYTIPELQEWWKVYAAAHSVAIKDDAPTNAGEHCKYCLAKGHCMTRITHMMTILKFDTAISHCDADQLIGVYNQISVIRSTLDAVEERVVKLARQGKRINGRKLVRSITRAKCIDELGLIDDAVESGIDKSKLYNIKLKGKTDVKKIVGKELANKYYITPDAGYSLVALNDKRPAIMADNKPTAVGKFGSVNK